MPHFFNPPTIAPPASSYSLGVTHIGPCERLVISGQLGMRPDGSVPADFAAQVELAFDNLVAVLAHAGFRPSDLVKITVYSTLPDMIGPVRKARERALGSHAPASSYLQVAGLAGRDYLVEIDGEAVRETVA